MTNKYRDYSLEVGTDINRDGWYEHREGGSVLKIHYRAFRVPSMKKFVIRHYAWATHVERAEGERMLYLLPRVFPVWEADGRARRRRHSKGHYYWTAPCGSFLDDPLVQFELEMLIDATSGASA